MGPGRTWTATPIRPIPSSDFALPPPLLFSEGQHRTRSEAPSRQGSTRGAAPPTPPMKRGGDEARPAVRAANQKAARGGGRQATAGPHGRSQVGPGGNARGGEARRPHLPLSTSCPGPTAPGKGAPARGGRGAPQGRTTAHSEAPHQARGPKPPSRPRTGTSHRRSSRKGTPPRPAQCTPA